MKHLSIRLLMTGFFVIAFSFIGFFVAMTFKNLNETKQLNNKTGKSIHALLFTEKLSEHVDDLNAAQRGYIFTSKESFAEPHEKAAAKLGEDISNLKEIQSQNPNRATELEALKKAVAEKIYDSKHSLNIFDSGGMSAYVEKIRVGPSKSINDRLNASLKNLETYDRNIINQSNQYLENLAQKTSYRFLVLAFLFFIILLSFLFLIYVDFKRKEKTASQLRYQASLIETVPDAIFTTNQYLVIETWNKYAAEMYGVSAGEATGRHINEIITVHVPEERREESLAALNKTGFYKSEYPVTKRNGEIIFILATIKTIVNNEGTVTGYIAVHRNITEQKKLEESQQQFNLELAKQVKIKTAETTNIMERITDGFLALDSNLTFTFVNKKAGEILGHEPANMIGKNIFSDFITISSKPFNEACQRSFQNQQYLFLENYYEPLGRWLENDIYPSGDGISVFFKDVTFKKKTETALKESEERYRHLIENIHAGVVVHNPDGSILLYNQEAARILGIGEDRKIPATAWYSISPDGNKLNNEEYPVMYVLKSGQPLVNITAGVDHPLKGRMWVLMNAFPEFDEERNLKQVVLTFVDITDRRRTEEELKRSEDNLNMAQAIAKTGSWEFSFLNNELKWSKELYRIYEMEDTPANQLYEKYRQRFHPEDLPNLDQMIEKAIETKKGYTYQHRIIVNNGKIKHILGIGEVILNSHGDVVGLKGTGQDITQMVKAEEKLQNSYKQIKQLVTHLQDIREQERTNMAREIHDELGQQLTGIKMYVSWLNKKMNPSENDIKEKFGATIQLIEDTIKSVRKISMDLRPSMLDDLGLMAALEWQSNEFEKRSGISTEFVNETGNREIPARLKTGLFRIYQESLTNVARHADAKKIVSSLRFENENLVLTISDDGKGFTFRNIESKKTLGLFGMKERTLEMGGHYEIKSEPGLGTTVSVTVPVNV